MKGKKPDQEFITNYIANCIENGISSSDDILQQTIDQIKIIDDKIKEVEHLKNKRSKLLDIISIFNKKNECDGDDKMMLSFYRMTNIGCLKSICNCIRNVSVLKINSEEYLEILTRYTKEEFCVCIKQLIENNIIIRNDIGFIPGILFNKYISMLRGNYVR